MFFVPVPILTYGADPRYARKLNMKGDGLGCRTAGYYIPSAFIREYVALCVKMKWLFLAFYVLLSVLILVAYKGIIW